MLWELEPTICHDDDNDDGDDDDVVDDDDDEIALCEYLTWQ